MLRPSILFPLFADISTIPGIGPRYKEFFRKLGITNIAHLLWHMPTHVIDRGQHTSLKGVSQGDIVTIPIKVEQHQPPRRKGLPYRILVSEGDYELEIVYFNAKSDYLERTFPLGERKAISGKIEFYQGKWMIAHPDYVVPLEDMEKIKKLEPVYPLTAGLGLRIIHKAIASALEKAPDLPEWLDPHLKTERGWPDWKIALRKIHQPSDIRDISPESLSRQRLAYDELLASQLALMVSREKFKQQAGLSIIGDQSLRKKILAYLPYQLTKAQNRALEEITDDMASSTRMLRLLQGDVGSGKTIVAFLAMLNAIEAKGQAVLLAPTDILARQHFASLEPLSKEVGIRIALLTGRDRGSARDKILADLAAGHIDLLIGTHAVIQDDILFEDLKLAVIDEQHRFGVDQRLALTQKGKAVDLLVMTATPIPRTLLLAVYGDIDVSKLDEKPPGRKPIDTRTIPLERLEEVIGAMRRAIDKGAQIFWVCPLVDESELVDLAAATDRHRLLSQYFRTGLAHGKQKAQERNQAIADFAAGNLDILVATTVIEVGIDIPKASIIVIEHAERFGLSQLHQLRGRVGRGSEKSSCILLYQAPLNPVAKARLSIMRESEDGFRIAEEDLRLRGGGEILGTRQSGMPEFRLADLNVHYPLLGTARDDARYIAAKNLGNLGLRGEALRQLLYLFERDAAIAVLRSG